MIINETHHFKFALEAQRDRTQPEQPDKEQPEEVPVVYTLDYPDLNLIYEQKLDEEKKADRQANVHPEPKPKSDFVPDLAEFFTSSESKAVGQNPQTDEQRTGESDGKQAGQEDATRQQPEQTSAEAQPEAKADGQPEPKGNDAQATKRTEPKTKPAFTVSKLMIIRSVQTSASFRPRDGGCPTRLDVMKMNRCLLEGEEPGLMFYFDRTSRTRYLVDSGSRVSVIPAEPGDKPDKQAKFELVAAGGSRIETFGTKLITVRMGGRYLKWTFIKAAVAEAIIGIDFIRAHRIVIDPFKNQLRTPADEVIQCEQQNRKAPCLNINVTDPILKLLEARPELTDESWPVKNEPNVVHFIRTDPNGKPPSAHTRHYNPAMQKIIRETFMEYLRLGYVRYSSSSWSSPLAIVQKANGQFRVCGDYRQLNSITYPCGYPLPYLTSFNNRMKGARIFSKMDLVRAYHQIKVHPPDIYKTAVSTPSGLFEFVRMPFGLRTAGSTLQRFLDSIFAGFEDFMFIYCDDLIVFSENEQQHAEHLKRVFDRLADFGLKINTEKSQFGRHELEFLGYHLDRFGITPSESKVRSILEYPVPTTVGHVRRYLGMAAYYSKHIPNFAILRSPLNSFMSLPKTFKQKKVQFNKQQLDAFHAINRALANATLLYHPDPNAILTIHTDSSSEGIGGVLHQVNRESEQLEPLFFYSKLLPDELESKVRPIFYKELEAAYQTVKRLHKFLVGQHTILYVDNEALFAALSKPKEQSAYTLRRMIYISQFTDEIRLVKGKDNVVADALSRAESYAPKTADINSLLLKPQVDFGALVQAQSTDAALVARKEDEHVKRKPKKIGDTTHQVWVYETNAHHDLFYVPESQVKDVLKACHSLYHPGVKGTAREIAKQYYWPTLKRDVKRWVKYCVPCQQAKASRTNQLPPSRFAETDRRFMQVHMDIVSLPVCGANGMSHIATFIDRHTRYMTAQPIPDMSTVTIWRALQNSWIKYFGCPVQITCDRGTQMDNPLFRYLCSNYRIRLNHTSAYRPQANGIIEREHLNLKNSLRAFEDPDWSDRLPVLVLAWNNAIRTDFGRSPAQLMFGNSANMPAGYFDYPSSIDEPIDSEIANAYLAELDTFRSPRTCAHAQRYSAFVHQGLDTCEYVWVRNETRSGLEMTYLGPYKVLERHEKHFKIEKRRELKHGATKITTDTVSIARIKPAFILEAP